MFTVTIIGRPNVGKSTLFNRLIGRRKSIVEPTPGATRDAVREEITLRGLPLLLQDSGGLISESEDALNAAVQKRAMAVAKKSDLIIFLVDVSVTHPDDAHYAKMALKTGTPAILVANKADDRKHDLAVYEFARLGFKDVLGVSAEHNRNIDALQDAILERMKAYYKTEGAKVERPAKEERGEKTLSKRKQRRALPPSEKRKEINIAIVGKPNAGKSTLLNAIIGEERSIVSDIAGTTRDPIDAVIERSGERVRLVDTAGLRRKKRVSENIEYYSVNRAIKSIEHADVAILLIDATTGVTDQDKKIASLIVDRHKALVVGVSKWDIRPKGLTWDAMIQTLHYEMPFVSYAVFARVCAVNEKDAQRLLGLAVRAAAVRRTEINTHKLSEVLNQATRAHTFQTGRTTFKIYYAAQSGTNPPTFTLFCNYPEKMTAGYRAYIENTLRSLFEFQGTPIVLKYKKREK